MGKDSLSHEVASPKWTFDASVAEVFDDMLLRSVPGLARACKTANLLLSATERCYPHYQNNNVLDLGVGTGTTCRYIVPNRKEKALFALDNAPDMVEKARANLKDVFGHATIKCADIREPLPITFPSKFGTILCVLTLMFTPPEYRLPILKRICGALSNEGVLFFMEKTVPSSMPMLLRDAYRAYKAEAGYSTSQINDKESALQGVLIPQSSQEWERMFREAGFTSYEMVFSELQFKGWLLRKSV